MPITFAAVTPHPPVLIPEVGKDNLKKLQKTEEAMKRLEQELYASKPDSVMVISSQEKFSADSFTINLSADYRADFKDFGDFGLELKFKSDYMSMQKIRAADESGSSVPIVMHSDVNLEHGFSVPLYFLTKHLKNIPIIPILVSGLDYKSHFEFGQFLYRQLSRINKRFAIVASADLSHKLTEEAPAGYSPKAKEFDDLVLDLLKKKNFLGLASIKQDLAKEAAESGLRSILIFSGVIESLNVEPEIMSYEGPFGVGYAVVNFRVV